MRSQEQFRFGRALVVDEHNVPAAFEHLLLAIRLDPDNAEAHQLLGQLYHQRQSFAEAERELRTALRLAHENPGDVTAGFVGDTHDYLGRLYGDQNRWRDAIPEFRTAATDLVYPTPAVAWADLGWAQHLAGDDAAGIESLRHAVQLDPALCMAHLHLGTMFVAAGQFQEAESALTHVVGVSDQTCNHYQDAWRLRGEARARLGQREDAGTDFERCVELGPDTDAGRACRRLLDAMH